MDRCVACGAELGVGRFCLNCGHPIGAPAPVVQAPPPAPEPVAEPVAQPVSEPRAQPVAEDPPATVPVQAADPTPVPPAGTALLTEPEVAPEVAPEPESVRPPGASDWDPSVDLLPYEEVDETEVDDPVPGRAWIAWVVGAVALVGLVLVLLRVFATDDDALATGPDETSSSEAAPTGAADDGADDGATAAPEAPRGVGKRLELAEGASFEVPGTAPPTTDLDGNLVAYEASQMGDGNPATTWRIAGDATGQQVVVTLAEPGVVNRVGLVNGYAKQVAGVDWYPNNRRILAVTWRFDDGTEVEQTFAEREAMQLLKVPPVETSSVTITVTAVTPPGGGSLGRDYTAISEVSLIGRRAG
ncbi:zinc ribbon domain-containing protein [Nocardioides sp. Soil774]|uniref:zinc ribbon domain-containing protein n=1 Tax=Nocardioides sp. Soil774 TaxID=1736408 RepID=UPI0012F76EA2|nr:zinc ribbon domain-containing protein [Nocardioides sp. Soil774]